jgi:beta propeller repeat protein
MKPMKTNWITVAFVAACLFPLGCADSGSAASAPDASGDTAADAAADVPVDLAPEVAPPDVPDAPLEVLNVPVGATACCLSQAAGRLAWAEDGDIFFYDLATASKALLHPSEGTQTDPVLVGDRLVWADDRGGDFDIYIMDLTDLVSELLVGGPGDQTAPSFDGVRVVWLDRPVGAQASETEVWALTVDGDSPHMQLTDDSAEQSFPHVNGDRVVWTDFRNDPDGMYMDPQGTAENNGDIMGYDFAAGAPFIVTENPGKQLRPAIEGDSVVWLDWREDDEGDPIGVQPEPKYHNFKVYVRTLPEGEEVFLTSGGWLQPDLWRRPGIHDGHVAWIADNIGAQGTQLLVAPIATGLPQVVHESVGVLTGLDFGQGAIAWMGPETAGWTDLSQLLDGGD